MLACNAHSSEGAATQGNKHEPDPARVHAQGHKHELERARVHAKGTKHELKPARSCPSMNLSPHGLKPRAASMNMGRLGFML